MFVFYKIRLFKWENEMVLNIHFVIELITKIKKLAQQLKTEQTEHQKTVQWLKQECDVKKEIEQQLLIVGKEKEV